MLYCYVVEARASGREVEGVKGIKGIQTMKIKDIITYLETIAPPAYQESYDNAGLIVGDPEQEATGALICLDSTEAVVEEAISKKCNLVIAHHPIVFKGLKRLTGRNYVERVVIKAIQHGIAIYAIHTNLDNVYYQGVNGRIAEKLGLEKTRVLAPRQVLKKLSAFVPPSHSDSVRQALFAAGAGSVEGSELLSYATLGVGTIAGTAGAQVKLEVFFQAAQESPVRKALLDSLEGQPHTYEIVTIENTDVRIGSGLIGQLPRAMKEKAFLQHLKESMQANCIRHTPLLGRPIRKVALCGGAGGFLLGKAMAEGADIFITGDYKYHEFFDADGRIIIADIGHYESEQFTIELLYGIISQKFSNFAAYCTEMTTNPVHYFY